MVTSTDVAMRDGQKLESIILGVFSRRFGRQTFLDQSAPATGQSMWLQRRQHSD